MTSDEFLDAFCDNNSPDVTCGCGVNHFATGLHSELPDTERSHYMANKADKPDKYFDHPEWDSIGWGTIDGIAWSERIECEVVG